MLEKAKAFIEGKGFTVMYKPTVEGLFGYVNSLKQLVLKEGQDTAQSLATLIHEIGHALLGHLEDAHKARDQRELEAESVSWIVCRNLGLDVDEAAFRYMAAWSRNDAMEVKLGRAAQRAAEVAQVILKGLGANGHQTERG